MERIKLTLKIVEQSPHTLPIKENVNMRMKAAQKVSVSGLLVTKLRKTLGVI